MIAAVRLLAATLTDRGPARPDALRIHEVAPGNLRLAAGAYTAAVALVAGVGGLFVSGERPFLVAWIYTGGALALPALLVNWTVARRELGSMPGGTAWSFGLVWIYVDGLALLYITARPDSFLRDLTVLAIMPPMLCIGVAALRLSWVQNTSLSIGRIVAALAGVFAVVAAATGAALGMRIGTSDAVWLAHPAAVAAVLITASAIVMAWYRRSSDVPTHPLNRFGLAALVLGALTSWSIVWQSLSGFALPTAPLLVLQALTMGMLLQIPLHAPRLVSPAGGRRQAIEVASREWFADDPDEPTVLPARMRRPAAVYVAVTVPAVALVGVFIEGRAPFLIAWVYTSAVYTTPAMVLGWVVARRTRYQATVWRFWFLGVVVLYLNGAGLLLTTVLDTPTVRNLAVVAVVPCVVLFGVSSIVAMRARSGSRMVWVDAVETAMAQAMILLAGLLAVGDRIWDNDEAWITIPTAIVAVAVTSGLVWSLMLHARVATAHRRLERLALVLATVAVVDAWAMLAQGVSGFTLPSAPLLGLQALTMGLLMLVPLHAPRAAPAGLERLPLQAQVRDGRGIALVALVAVPSLFVAALLSQQRVPWSLEAFGATMVVLLALTVARQQLTFAETRRLYRLVSEAADDRRRLLAEVMRSVDEDRHRVASQLHDQAIFSYVAFDSMTREVANAEASDRGGHAAVLADVSGRLRDDLAEQAEALRHLMLAVRPLEAGGAGSQVTRLTSPIRAYVDSLFGDGPSVRLRLEIDPELQLDWTTETIVLRIVQEAVGNVWSHAAASTITVRVGVEQGALSLRVIDDGCGFDPAAAAHESGLATMRSFAALVDGRLDVDSTPDEGTTVTLRVGRQEAVPGPVAVERSPGRTDADQRAEAHDHQPRLRLVTSGGDAAQDRDTPAPDAGDGPVVAERPDDGDPLDDDTEAADADRRVRPGPSTPARS